MDARLYSSESDEVSSSKLWPRRRLDLCLSFPTIFVIGILDKQPHIYLSGWETLRGRRWSAWGGRWGCSQDAPQNSSRTQNSESLPEIQNNLSAIISQMGTLPERSWTLGWWTPPCMWYTSLCPLGHTSWVIWYELKYCLHSKRVWVITYYCTGSNTR